MFDFKKLTKKYYEQSRNDAYPRLKAWDYLWDYVQSFNTWADLASDQNIRNTALNIGFYLANWGMLRASSELQRVNIRFFEELSGHIFSDIPEEFWRLTLKDFKINNVNNHEIFDEGLKKIRSFESERVSWTQTLTTKLLLGVWGHCPASDRYFNLGARQYRRESGKVLSGNINGKYLTRLNQARLDEFWGISEFKTPLGNRYPMGKVIDMAFFQYGVDLS